MKTVRKLRGKGTKVNLRQSLASKMRSVPSNAAQKQLNEQLIESFFIKAPHQVLEMLVRTEGYRVEIEASDWKTIGTSRPIDEQTTAALGVHIDPDLRDLVWTFERDLDDAIIENITPALTMNIGPEAAWVPIHSGICDYLNSNSYFPKSEWAIFFSPESSSLINPVLGYHLVEYREGTIYRMYRLAVIYGGIHIDGEKASNAETVLEELLNEYVPWLSAPQSPVTNLLPEALL